MRALASDNIWPGYVAAMASLLLGLLLVAAVLVVTTGQIGQLSESYQRAMREIGFSSGKEVERLARAAGLQGDAGQPSSSQQDPSSPARGRGTGKVEALQARLMAERQRDAKTAGDKSPALDLVNANFDREAARRAARLVAEDKALLAQIDLSKVDVQKIKLHGIDLSKIDLAKKLSQADLKKIDFSAIQFGQLSQSRIDALTPFVAKEAIRYQLALQKQKDNPATLPAAPVVAPSPTTPAAAAVVEAKTAHAAEPQPVAATAKAHEIRLNYIEDALEPLPEQKPLIVQSLAALNRADSQLRLWVNLPGEDAYLKRIAYSRLMSLRTLALEAGFSARRISVAIESAPQAAPSLRDMTLYISEVRP